MTDPTFTLSIKLREDAMQSGADISRALSRVAELVAIGESSRAILDDNGNTVGSWQYKTAPQYISQSARDAQESGYGNQRYWDYLERAAFEHVAYWIQHNDFTRAREMLTQSLSASLIGNDGN